MCFPSVYSCICNQYCMYMRAYVLCVSCVFVCLCVWCAHSGEGGEGSNSSKLPKGSSANKVPVLFYYRNAAGERCVYIHMCIRERYMHAYKLENKKETVLTRIQARWHLVSLVMALGVSCARTWCLLWWHLVSLVHELGVSCARNPQYLLCKWQLVTFWYSTSCPDVCVFVSVYLHNMCVCMCVFVCVRVCEPK